MLMMLLMVASTVSAQQAPPRSPPPPTPGKRWIVMYDKHVERDVHRAVGRLGAAIVRAFNTTWGGVAAFERPDGRAPAPFATSAEALKRRAGGCYAASRPWHMHMQLCIMHALCRSA